MWGDQVFTGLQELKMDSVDEETVNTIFREAHSIKKGSEAFGFSEITNFTHILETLLEEIRNGTRDIYDKDIEILLLSVDVSHELGKQFNNDSVASGAIADSEVLADVLSGKVINHGWHISFRPHAHMLETDNDPVRMFRELNGFGHLTVKTNTTALHPFVEMISEGSYLCWQLELISPCKEEEVWEIFDWVEGDCDLEITPISNIEEETKETEADSINELAQTRSEGDRRSAKDRRTNTTDRRKEAWAFAGENQRSGANKKNES